MTGKQNTELYFHRRQQYTVQFLSNVIFVVTTELDTQRVMLEIHETGWIFHYFLFAEDIKIIRD